VRRLCSGFLLLFLAAASPAATVRLIELRGHARVLALDEPILKGRVFVFHRYPDGVFLSVPSQDVFGIAMTTVAEKARIPAGETIVLGPTGEGSSVETAPRRGGPAAMALSADLYAPYDYFPYVGCCSGPPIVPRPPGPLPPPLVGPNGFPVVPGTRPLEIGPNGFPILAPSPAPR